MTTPTPQLICFTLLAMVLSANLSAEEENRAGFGSPDTVDNQIAKDGKNRDQSVKDGLAEKGVNIAVDYSFVGLGANDSLAGEDDTSGGGMLRFYGSWDAVNRGKSNVGGLVWKVEHRHAYTDTAPKYFEFGAGGLGLITPPFSDEGTRLTNLYWRQRFNGGNSIVTAGLLDATDHFDVYALASPWTGFMNFAFSTGATTVALPGDAAFGVAAGTMLSDKVFLIGGITDMESDATKPFESVNSFFDEGHHFKSVELGWTQNKDSIYTDNLHVSLWQADESEMQGSTKGHGAVVSFSRMVGRWLPFVRAGVSEDAGALSEKSLSTGFGYYGLGGESNNLGAAINWADTGEDDQITAEVFYLMKSLPWLEITPDIQIVQNPALNPEENQLVVFGLRGRLIW